MLFWHASHTFAGVAGISMWSAAPFGIAFEIAFITAAIAAVVPASPVPLTPSGLLVAGDRMHRLAQFGRHVVGVRHAVVHERAGHQLTACGS